MAESDSEAPPIGIAFGSRAGISKPQYEENLGDKFKGLNFYGEKEEDLDHSGEGDRLLKETRWTGMFRVHIMKLFSHVVLFKHMRNAWVPTQVVTFKTMNDNSLAQFMCLGYWNRVMGGGHLSLLRRGHWRI